MGSFFSRVCSALLVLVGSCFKGCENDSCDDNDADKSQHGRYVVIVDGGSDPESSDHRHDDRKRESDDVVEVE